MSGHGEEAREEVYNRLSDLRWSTLRHYASFFCGLPSMDRRNKHDLIYWIIRSSPPSVLDRLLTFAAEASQQADTHLGKRTRARDGTDEDEPAATRVRAAEAVDSSSFLENGDLNRPPRRSLANNLWIGRVPPVLTRLSFPEQLLVALVYPRVFVFKLFPRRVNNFYLGSDNPSLQRAMCGNVCSYELDAPGVAEMVQGNLMPRRPEILASVIQITLFGQRRLPENWMPNNPRFYGHIRISSEHLDSLPDDGVPLELMAIARHVDDPDLVHEQNDSYIPGKNDEIDSDACNADVDSEEGSISDEDDLESVPPEVFPIQVSGAIDTDLTSMSAPDLLRQGFRKMDQDDKKFVTKYKYVVPANARSHPPKLQESPIRWARGHL
ncbi:hypothetical protein F5887DRAFT_1214938 [Amanita rubescens]|nr:hypothetical protein F5887DRAFT_1214938 [Amanita rubescens]